MTNTGKNNVDKRQLILDIATSVFAQNGYRNTDVQTIANKANLGKGTIYRYFGSKKKLFLSVADYGMKRLISTIHKASHELHSPRERICAVAREYLEFFEANPDLVEIFILERSEFPDQEKPTYISYWESNINKSIKSMRSYFKQVGINPSKAKPAMEALHDLLYGTIFTNRYRKKTKLSSKSRIKLIIDIFCNGALNNEKGCISS